MKTNNWKYKTIYQIFPRSFYDSNNDGDGDIKGIIEKLDYLKDLGITAIWLCPIYDTSFADAGYDVKDYKSVWNQFGTLNDFKKMTQEAKKRGIEIIMDIVLNHVSFEHKWFQKAKQSTKNKEHNYFIWRDKLSINEQKAESIFGGSAWEYEPQVQKYYFHLFSKEQVDLNWEHEDMINALVDVVNFWYSLGVRGFRLDAIKHISKSFPNNSSVVHSWGPTIVKRLQKFNQKVFSNKKDVFLLGEASGITLQELLKYGVGKDKISNNFFNFAWWHIGWGVETGRNGYNPNWNFKDFINNMKPFQESKKVTPELMTTFLSNHDTSRAVSRWGNENFFWKESAKTLAMLQFALKGIPSIYYGEEIGMLNPRFKNRKDFRDVDALNSFRLLVDQKKYYSEEEMNKYHNINGRDNSRTPMQWNNKKNCGFNKDTKPWIKIGCSYKYINVEQQQKDPNSILNFYKKIIKLRNSKEYNNIFVNGDSKLDILKNGIFKITRSYKGDKIIVLINMRNLELKFNNPLNSMIILNSWNNNNHSNKLRPFESLMFKIIR